MLKITPYLGIFVVIVSVAGLWYPKLGYFLLIVFASLLAVSPFRGRWFCGNLCPRGSFNDFWLQRLSRSRKIPVVFRKFWVRIIIFALMMFFMAYRIVSSQGVIDRIGMVFVTMCIATTLVAVLFGIFYSPRAWCTFCPMGTVQRLLGTGKYVLKVQKSRCVDCGICNKVCPMQLEVKEILGNPDCIKCGRCVNACPKKALSFLRD